MCVQSTADKLNISFLETSAKAATNVEKAFLTMAAEIKNNLASTQTSGQSNKTGPNNKGVVIGAGNESQSSGCCS